MAFEWGKIGTYVLTAFMGGWFFKLADMLAHKTMRVKDIERVHRIELERLRINHELDTRETASRLDAATVAKANREYNTGVHLTNLVREIDMEALGKHWVWIGRQLGRIF